MKSVPGHIRLSASDLSNHLACHYLTESNRAAALGLRTPPDWKAPHLWVLQQRGFEHETAFLDHLKSSGLHVVDLSSFDSESAAFAATRDAIQQGADVIAQATLAAGRWFGRADVLRRVERPSRLGAWSYEVYDCKLARETKAATILQLSLYSELLAAIQGALPESMYVVPPAQEFQPERYRVLDFAAYYRFVKARLESAVAIADSQLYPEPAPHCDVCRWWPACDTRWRQDDHLSFVAGISQAQRKQLAEWDVTTVEQLAALPLPLQKRPAHGSIETYIRVREQARVQVAGRTTGQPVHELLDIEPDRGLCRLPEPSPGDIFFDLEGDPFVGDSGREYLFGFATDTDYHSHWAPTAEDEKHAFQWFVDSVMERWARYPAMHIYHFAPYEPSALKRLMGRYATREDEIDRILRARLLVDLHAVVKQAVRAGVEQYSLKALERFHNFQRLVPLENARAAMRHMEHALELGRPIDLTQPFAITVAGYNADDCFSTRSLRDWLERERTLAGREIPRPAIDDGAPSEAVGERQQRVARLIEELTAGIPADPQQRTEDQAARWLLANLLDWHRREMKAEYWEYFRLRDLTDEDLLDERSAVAGLNFLAREWDGKTAIDRYAFEKQETRIRCGDKVCAREESIGTVEAVDLVARTITLRRTRKTACMHPAAVFADGRGPRTDAQADSLFRLGEWVKTYGLDTSGDFRAARDLLLRRPPRLRDTSSPLIRAGESAADAARRLAVELDHTVLAIQGPPGAGKTWSGARMICELVRQGRKVGVTAMSHKVIRNLLDEVLSAARQCGLQGLSIFEKVKDVPEQDTSGIQFTTGNPETLAALQPPGPIVVAGTSWLWSRPEFRETVDVLFVDEAGQMSLANVLAVSQAAGSVVLLGDPQQQLDEPLQGSHPEGAEASALEHLLGGAKTISANQGLFLEKTWRLHPKICEFTSEVFYEGRLHSREGLEQQRIEGHPWLGNAGLWFVPVPHEGNRNASPEEVESIAALVNSLLQPGVKWIDDQGRTRPLRLDDILVIAPYNAQVSDLSARLPNARVGTVDKFQGQEAAVVIYSLTTSSPEDAPRGVEFLYSLNRLNVATSRARAIVIVVGSPRLCEPECRSPRQMQLANALCRYTELAQVVDSARPAVIAPPP